MTPWAFICWAADILVPRFVREDVALEQVAPGEYVPVVAMRDVDPGERFDGIVTMESFNLFGRGIFPKVVGEVRPFVNPHDS